MYVRKNKNVQRSQRGHNLLVQYVRRDKAEGRHTVKGAMKVEGVETVLSDMVTDLVHGVHRSGFDPTEVDLELVFRRVRDNLAEEAAGEE